MMTKIFTILKNNYRTIFAICALILVLDIFLLHSYLLFHVFIELFSIVIAFSLFTITWNARKIMDNQYLLLIGIACLFISILDIFHTLTYKGMNIISSPMFYANQFWIATRFLESITLLLGFWFLKRKTKLNIDIVFLAFSFVTLIIILSILYWEIFPVCFIEGAGQTKFKIYSEYIIILFFIISLVFLINNKRLFGNFVFKLLTGSIIFAVISEFCFTLYISNYGFSNQLGHYAKLITIFFIYKANVETGFVKPTETIFKNLKASEKNYRDLSEKYRMQGKKLTELNATKDKFFSIIAHDLKNPFSSLLGLSDLLIENAALYNPEKIHQYAQSINIACTQTYALLENLLEWSRLQTGQFNPNPVKVKSSELITEVILLCEPNCKSKNIDLQFANNYDSYILADKEMIKVVLRNLVTNALKFTFQLGIIKVETLRIEDELLFIVSDTGIGIEPELIGKLFRIDSNLSRKGTAGESGTGLGLILCKEFIEKHNGKIWVESEIGKGSDFKFTLPLYAN